MTTSRENASGTAERTDGRLPASSSTRTDGARFDRSFLPRLVVRGEDRRDFFHRVATNDVANLRSGEGAPTLLLERTGRLVDRLILAERGDDCLLVGSRGRGEAVRDWIRKYTITEDVEVEDVTASTGMITVLGPRAPHVLEEVLGVDVEDLAAFAHRTTSFREHPVNVLRGDDVGGKSFLVVAPRDAFDALDVAFAELAEAAEEAYRALRIEAGVPAFGAEFSEKTIPLEARMTDAISFTKGCYIGQEVIARLHHYDRVKRALVRLSIAGAELPSPGAFLAEGETKIGALTSAVEIDGSIVALGYVPRGKETPGACLTLCDGGTVREAKVLTLTPRGEPT